MPYVLFYKTEDMKYTRYYYAIIYKTKLEAEEKLKTLLQRGHNGLKVIYTSIKKGKK